MKKEKNLELLKKQLKQRGKFKVYFDGEDLEVFTFNPAKNRYEGEIIGYLDLETIVKAIKDDSFWIQVEAIEK